MSSDEQFESETPGTGSGSIEDPTQWLRMQDNKDISSSSSSSDAASSEVKGHSSISLIALPPKRQVIETYEPEEEVIVLPEKMSRNRSPEQLEKARRRQALFLQKRREQKKRRIFYSRVRILLRMVFSLLLLAGMYFAAVAPFWHFSRQNVTLHGVNLTHQEHLARFFEPLNQKPIYLINPIALEKTIRQKLSLLQDVHIRRRLFPVGLDIFIVEKPSWGVLYSAPPIFSETLGDVTASQENSSTGHRPQPTYLLHEDNTMTDLAPFKLDKASLTAMNNPVPIVSSGTHLKKRYLTRYQKVTQFLNSQPKLAKLQYLDISNPYDVYAQFEGFRVRIGQADSSVLTRLKRLFSVIPAIEEHQSEIQFIDLRWHQQVLFKKKSVGEITAEKQQQEQRQDTKTASPSTETQPH